MIDRQEEGEEREKEAASCTQMYPDIHTYIHNNNRSFSAFVKRYKA
jgi:hypothetical protein